MKKGRQMRVAGMLGVGFDHDDGHIRITQGEGYQVFMGSDESHSMLRDLLGRIHDAVCRSGRKMTDYTPEEFIDLLSKLK
jgi:hypothetical protein